MGPHGTEIAWPAKLQDKKSRTHNHHISLRERIKEYQNRTQENHPKSEGNVHEKTKAAAWAVFQRHGGGGVGLSLMHRSAVRRPTRFKIEAQMKHEIARPSVSESVVTSWDAGSTLFDSFELDSLLKTLDHAANTGSVSQQKQLDEEAGAIVVYSQKHWISRPNPNPPPQRQNNRLQGQRSFPNREALDDGRLDTVNDMRPLKTTDNDGQRPVSYKLAGNLTVDDLYKKAHDDAESDPFANFGHTPSPFNMRRNERRSFDSSLQEKSGKGGSRDPNNRSKWKSLLHTLHLDSASGLFNRFQGFHAQVAPHDSHKKLENKGSRTRAKADAKKTSKPTTDGTRSQKHSIVSAQADAYFDPRFDPKNLHISKDVHPPALKSPPAPSWKLGLKSMLSRPFSRQASSVSENSSQSGSPKQTALATLEPTRKSGAQKKADSSQSAWSSLTTKLQHHQNEQLQRRRQGTKSEIETVSLSHHEHHHHYHHHHHHHDIPPEAGNYELTVQAISRRVSRSSSEEKERTFSIEEGGVKAPRNSLATPRSSGDPSAVYEERVQSRLTPWEAEADAYVR